jgi:hypothetical protein
MNVEVQGPNECALSTIGALLSVPLADVRTLAQAVAKRRGTPFFYHSVLNEVARTLDPTLRLNALLGFGVHASQTGGKVRAISNRVRSLPAKGRGAIRFTYGDYRIGHITPWEDGLVYDPQDLPTTGPLTLTQYRRLNPLAHVDYITMEVQ